MENSISVIIPTLNGGELFHQSLQRIMSQEIDVPLEIIVIDSGSSDQTVDLCHKYSLKLIQIPVSSFSHGSSRNLAISGAKSEICVLTVQDAVPVDRDWLATLTAPLRNNNRIAGVFGQQISHQDASPLSKSCKLLWYQNWRDDWRQPQEQPPIDKEIWQDYSVEQKKKIARFDNVNSCIRKSAWREIPFPDVPYAEDVAWAIDALTSGYSIFWQPNARMFHSHERSLAYEFKRSYVDMKSFMEIFDDSSRGMTSGMARSVIRWLADEAQRFLQARGERLSTGVFNCIEDLARADVIWQKCGRVDAIQERSSKTLTGFTSTLQLIKNTVQYRCYQYAAGTKWFDVVRKSLLHLKTRVMQKDHREMSELQFLIEIKGRHHFFFNQLLNVYSVEKPRSSDMAQVIRFGAAAMVGGAFLGQFIDTTDCSLSDEYSNVDYKWVGGSDPQIFWQTLNEWCRQDFNHPCDGLLCLDYLLRGSI